MAGTLRGGGVKAGPLRKKRTFFVLFPFKNKNNFTLDNSKYGHITLKFVGRYFYLLKYFPKNKAILVQKLWGEKKLSKSVFGYFKTNKKNSTKKIPMAIKLEGGG